MFLNTFSEADITASAPWTACGSMTEAGASRIEAESSTRSSEKYNASTDEQFKSEPSVIKRSGPRVASTTLRSSGSDTSSEPFRSTPSHRA